MNANKAKRNRGFTIIELMIVVMIVSILLALAYPSYVNYVRKSNRGEAQQLLLNWAINQEIWRSNNPEYAPVPINPGDPGIQAPCTNNPDCNYDFGISDRSANSFTLTATAKNGNDQENDTARDASISCASLTLNQTGVKGPPACWE